MISIQPLPFLIQIFSFFLLWFALRRLLFEPVSRVLAERAKRTTGVRADAIAMREQMEVAAADYDRRIQEVRRSLASELDSQRGRTAAEEHAIVAAAQAQASDSLTKEREALQGQLATARGALDSRASELAALMLERVGGRKFA
ncbi:MAG TPA: hypothetical protein VEB21_18735 [Terriglobales bacterium]|nr:hypothetical protein [Terriglobales bacterium]